MKIEKLRSHMCSMMVVGFFLTLMFLICDFPPLVKFIGGIISFMAGSIGAIAALVIDNRQANLKMSRE